MTSLEAWFEIAINLEIIDIPQLKKQCPPFSHLKKTIIFISLFFISITDRKRALYCDIT
jgi:hypothetical protein